MSKPIPNLNYISLINRFWATNLEHDFTGNEAKLYFFLLHISNSLGWKNPFKHSLRQVQAGTGISQNSIKSAQLRLVETGLIAIKNGVAGNHFNYENKTEYTILSVSKIDTDIDTTVSENDTLNDATVSKIDTERELSVSESVSVSVSKNDTIDKLNKTKEINYKNILLSELSESDLDKSLLQYFEITKSFYELFKQNLKELGTSTQAIEGANGTWIDDVKLIVEEDNFKIEDIREAYRLIKHDTYWKQSIINTLMLRENMAQLKPKQEPTQNNESEIAINLNNWAKQFFHEKYINETSLDIFDKLIRIDKYSPEDIVKAIAWARNDDFWSTNFLSPVKLRNKDKQGVKYIDIFIAKTLKNETTTARGNNQKGCTLEQLADVIQSEFGGVNKAAKRKEATTWDELAKITQEATEKLTTKRRSNFANNEDLFCGAEH